MNVTHCGSIRYGLRTGLQIRVIFVFYPTQSSHNEMIAGGETLECAWDVVSILCGALQSNIQPLVQANDTLDLLQRCFTVRSSCRSVVSTRLYEQCWSIIVFAAVSF